MIKLAFDSTDCASYGENSEMAPNNGFECSKMFSLGLVISTVPFHMTESSSIRSFQGDTQLHRVIRRRATCVHACVHVSSCARCLLPAKGDFAN